MAVRRALLDAIPEAVQLKSKHVMFDEMHVGVTLAPVHAFTITPPDWSALRMSANGRSSHYGQRSDRTAWWREAGKLGASGSPRFGIDRTQITVAYRCPDNRRREVQNFAPIRKAIIDGVVDAGVIPDDADRYVRGADDRRLMPNGPWQVHVLICEVLGE